ncbi:MAG: hypothetical protein QX189_19965 [Methylococcales bacterium]
MVLYCIYWSMTAVKSCLFALLAAMFDDRTPVPAILKNFVGKDLGIGAIFQKIN